MLSLWGLIVSAAGGQEGEEVRRLLDVRRRQIELQSARQEVKRLEELYNQGIIPKTNLDRARMELEKAQLAYQEAVLSLLALEPRISVRRAVKYQAADGRRFVRLTVTNLTPTFDDAQFRLLQNFEGADPIPDDLRRRDVQDIFISLKDPGAPAMGALTGARAGPPPPPSPSPPPTPPTTPPRGRTGGSPLAWRKPSGSSPSSRPSPG